MSVQTVEVCVHVEMQLQLIYDLNTANTRFTILYTSWSQLIKLQFNYLKLLLLLFKFFFLQLF